MCHGVWSFSKKLDLLVEWKTKYRPQLRADFREYYGVSFDALLSQSWVETADLVAGLPSGSRTMSAYDPSTSWNWNEHILAQIFNLLSAYIFYQDKKNKHKKAPTIEPPKKKKIKRQQADTTSVKALLNMARKEA